MHEDAIACSMFVVGNEFYPKKDVLNEKAKTHVAVNSVALRLLSRPHTGSEWGHKKDKKCKTNCNCCCHDAGKIKPRVSFAFRYRLDETE